MLVDMERWRGEIVWRDAKQHADNILYQQRLQLFGARVSATTQRGRRKHACVVVAVYNPSNFARQRPPYEFASALSRVRWEMSPKDHRCGDGAVILRIDESTHPNMVGRYLHVGDFSDPDGGLSSHCAEV